MRLLCGLLGSMHHRFVNFNEPFPRNPFSLFFRKLMFGWFKFNERPNSIIPQMNLGL